MDKIVYAPSDQVFRGLEAEQPGGRAVGKYETAVAPDIDRVLGQFYDIAEPVLIHPCQLFDAFRWLRVAPESARSGFHRIVIKTIGIPARLFGMIHRLVGNADQGARIPCMIGEDADAQAGRDAQLVAGYEEIFIQCM